jgi:hypothetical protein
MNNDILPSFDAHGLRIEAVLSGKWPGVLRQARSKPA